MNATRKKDTVTITLSVEEAARLAAAIQGSRDAAMNELFDRLIGSAEWRFIHDKKNAQKGIVDLAVYNRVVEDESDPFANPEAQ